MMTTQSNKRTARERAGKEGWEEKGRSWMGRGWYRVKTACTEQQPVGVDGSEWALRNYFGSLPVVKVWGLSSVSLWHCVAWLPVGHATSWAGGGVHQCRLPLADNTHTHTHTESKGESWIESSRVESSRVESYRGRYQAGRLYACLFVKPLGNSARLWLKFEDVKIVEIVKIAMKMLRCENKRQLSFGNKTQLLL